MRLQPNDGSFHVYPPPVRTQKFNTRMTVVFIPASFSVRARRNFFYENDACPSPVRSSWPSHARARASRRKHDRPHQCRHYACWLCRSLPASRSTPLSGRVSAFPNRLMMMMMTCGHQKAAAIFQPSSLRIYGSSSVEISNMNKKLPQTPSTAREGCLITG